MHFAWRSWIDVYQDRGGYQNLENTILSDQLTSLIAVVLVWVQELEKHFGEEAGFRTVLYEQFSS